MASFYTDENGNLVFYDSETGQDIDTSGGSSRDIVNYNPADPYANTPYDPSQGTGQGISFYTDPETGVPTYYKASALPSGYYDPKALTSDTSSGFKMPGIGLSGAKKFAQGFLTKDGDIDLLKAFLGIAAVKSMMDQRNVQQQARGYQGKVDMALKAVQPANVPAARAYGSGAVGQPYKATTYAAEGGIMGLADGGLRNGSFVIPADVVSHFGNGSSEAGLKVLKEKLGASPIKGEGDGMSDSIDTTIDGKQPAKVAHEEAIVSPEMVAKLGKGDPKKGAKALYSMMDRVRKARTGTKKQGKQIKPEKFMPGGIAGYAGGGAVAFAEGGISPGTSVTSNLSEWAGPYVTGMLSQANALANQPYQAYTGQLTAGTSPLQQQAFTGISSLGVPSQFGAATNLATQAGQKAGSMGYAPSTFNAPSVGASNIFSNYAAPGDYQSGQFNAGFNAPAAYQTGQFNAGFNEPGAYQAGQFSTGLGPVGSVQGYMSPYQQNVIDIQAREARRQADIGRGAEQARLSQAGAYGGSRQAIMEAERQRNLGQQIGDIQEKGLQAAYDRALQQRLQESGLGLEAQKAQEAARQFGYGQQMNAAQLRAQYGLEAQKAMEASRQFGYGQQMSAAQLQSQFGLDAQKAQELSRQFGYGQRMSAAQLQAQFGLDAQRANQLAQLQASTANQNAAMEAQRAAEQSRQFGANLGLQGLQQQLSAASQLGTLGAQQFGTQLQGLEALTRAGATQSAIEQQALDAQRAQFEEARAYPYKQLQFQQSMLSGLPISTQNAAQQTTGMQDLSTLLRQIYGIGSAQEGTP